MDSPLRDRYSEEQVAQLLKLPVDQLRLLVEARYLEPARDEQGRPLFTFRDLVVLRTAKGLVDARIAPERIRESLSRLTSQLPAGRPLTGVIIHADAQGLEVRESGTHWDAASGQAFFDFAVAELTAPVEARGDAETWFQRGCELETVDPARAIEAYRHAVALAPAHADAQINLGRLLHEAEDAAGAEVHYRAALEARPLDATAAFNLGTALEDLGRSKDAISAYAQAIAADPGCADAYFNLARLYERAGHRAEAFRHLNAYRRLAAPS